MEFLDYTAITIPTCLKEDKIFLDKYGHQCVSYMKDMCGGKMHVFWRHIERLRSRVVSSRKTKIDLLERQKLPENTFKREKSLAYRSCFAEQFNAIIGKNHVAYKGMFMALMKERYKSLQQELGASSDAYTTLGAATHRGVKPMREKPYVQGSIADFSEEIVRIVDGDVLPLDKIVGGQGPYLTPEDLDEPLSQFNH